MKRIISFLIAMLLVVSLLPITSVFVSAEETNTVITGNAETDQTLSDYGFDFSLDSIEGYDPANGDVKNSPFGTAFVENFGFQEPLYIGVGGKNYIEASLGTTVGNAADGMLTEQTGVLSKGFSVSGSGEIISTGSITYSVTAVGDFSRDTRNNGVAVLFTTGVIGSESTKIYFSVFDPTDTDSTPSCKLLSTIAGGVIQKTEDLSTLLNIACGNYLAGNENSQKISPDEITLRYPKTSSGNTSLVTEVYSLSDVSGTAWKDAGRWVKLQDLSITDTGALTVLSMGDVNEDGFDDIIVVTSYGVSRMKYDIKLSKTSETTVSVWLGGDDGEYATVNVKGLYRAAAAVCDINNDGMPNLVLCGLTGISVTNNETTLKEAAIALDVQYEDDQQKKGFCLMEDFQCETTSQISSDLYDTLNATLRQKPVVIKTVQMGDNGSNQITASQEDSPNMVMYDGMLLTAKTTTKEMRFVGDSRADYTKADQVLVGAYSGMVYTNPTAVSRDDIFMLSVKGSSMKVYNHSKATAVTRKNNAVTLNDVNVVCFALPNTDYDTGILRYNGWALTFTDPALKVILAATPTFGDFLPIDENYIVMGQTIYTESSSTGGGQDHTWKGGGALDINVGAFHGSVEAGYHGSYTKKETTTKSTTFVATKETLAVVTTVPVEIYNYTLFANTPDGLETYDYSIPVPHEEVYSTMTIPEYDKVAIKYNKQTLTGNAVIHTDGDPASYTYTNRWITEKYGSNCQLNSSREWVRTNYNTGSTGATLDNETTSEQGHGGYIDVTLQGTVKIASIGAAFGYAGKQLWTSGTGTTYTSLVRNLPDEAAEGGYGFKWKMKTYLAKIENRDIPVVTYEIQDCSTNPRVPANVSARGCDAYDENGNRIPAIKISWEEFESDESKDISYAILRKNSFTGAYSTVGTVPYGVTSFIDKDKKLEFGTEYEYSVRAFKNLSTAANRYSIMSQPETAKTLSKHGTIDVSVPNDKVEVQVGKFVQIGVSAVGNGGELEYQWMRRIPLSYEWTSVIDATSATCDIVGATNVMDGAEYRCLVMETITLADGTKEIIYTYSDVIKLSVKGG